MSRSRDTLEVRYTPSGPSSRRVGWLALDRGRPVFEFAEDWLTTPLPLSPVKFVPRRGLLSGDPRMPYGLPGVFADSLPDAWGERLADRYFLSRGRALDDVSVLDRLTLVGTSGMGALTYHPSEERTAHPAPLDLDALNHEATRVLQGSASDLLPQLIETAGSSGGARPKLLVSLDAHDQLRTDDGSFQDGFTPWIVKLRYTQDGPDAAAVEFAYHQLARHAGIRVPAARLLTTPSDRFFAVERFDRSAGTRIHMLSLSGLLDLPQSYFAAEYGEVGRLIASLCESYAETTEFARRMVFSVLAHNRDDHLKNTALLMDADGTWRLAPAYDLTFMRGPGGEHSMLIAGEGRNPTDAHLHRAGETMGLESSAMRQIIDEVRTALGHWTELADAVGLSSTRRDEIRRAWR